MNNTTSSVPLEPLVRERLGRLRAELDAAEARTELARLRFEQEVGTVCRILGISGPIELDLKNGNILRQEEGG